VYYIKVINANVLFVDDTTRTTHVTTASKHNKVPRIKFCDAGDLILGD
jgi:hypothetical protein